MNAYSLRAFSLYLLSLASVVFLGLPEITYAGFGITPPYVENQRLTRGSTFDQKITLVRSDATQDLKVQVTMNIPGIENWFSIDRGVEFIMPAGTTQLPMVVNVRVPQEAEYKNYKGVIRIRTSSTNQEDVNGVSIALGAQVDVDLMVVDKIFDFNVRRIRIADLEEGRMRWGLSFPGKIRFFVTAENTGNEIYGPTKVKFDIYDSELETLLETVENTNDIETIEPFAIKEVIAELPTRLSAGRYIAKYTIYKGEEIAQNDQVNLSIATLGAVAGYTGYGWDGLSFADKLKVIVVLGTPIMLVGFSVVALGVRRRRLRRRRRA